MSLLEESSRRITSILVPALTSSDNDLNIFVPDTFTIDLVLKLNPHLKSISKIYEY